MPFSVWNNVLKTRKHKKESFEKQNKPTHVCKPFYRRGLAYKEI